MGQANSTSCATGRQSMPANPNRNPLQHEALTQAIIGCAMLVHNSLGPGFLEAIYQRALLHELNNLGIPAESAKPIKVTYDGVIIGEFEADVLVDNLVMLELKANQSLVLANEVQLVNYLAATGIEIGLLLNFGSNRLEFKRKIRLLQTPANVT